MCTQLCCGSGRPVNQGEEMVVKTEDVKTYSKFGFPQIQEILLECKECGMVRLSEHSFYNDGKFVMFYLPTHIKK